MEWKNLLAGALISASVHALALYSLSGISLELSPRGEERAVKVSIRYVKAEKKKGEGKAPIARKITKEHPKKVRKVSKSLKKRVKKRRVQKHKKRKKPVAAKRSVKREKKVAKADIAPKRERILSEKALHSREGVAKEEKKSSKSSAPASVGRNFAKREGIGKEKREKYINYGESFARENLDKIRKYIMENLKYPYIARRMGWQGKVVVEILLSKEGCEEVKLVKSSGYKILDKNALETVSRVCGKFPKPQRAVSLRVPIHYRLR